MTNELHVGLTRSLTPRRGAVFIHDEVYSVPDWKHPRTFDPLVHSFNPLKGLDYKTARQIANVLYAIYPQGENTLTVPERPPRPAPRAPRCQAARSGDWR
jgi:hypothetical protein